MANTSTTTTRAALIAWTKRKRWTQNELRFGGQPRARRYLLITAERSAQTSRGGPLDDLPDRFDSIAINDRERDQFDELDDRDRRRKDDDYDSRPFGTYAFASSASISNTPPRVGSASSQRKRPGIRQRSSSIASNLSFGKRSSTGRAQPRRRTGTIFRPEHQQQRMGQVHHRRNGCTRSRTAGRQPVSRAQVELRHALQRHQRWVGQSHP